MPVLETSTAARACPLLGPTVSRGTRGRPRTWRMMSATSSGDVASPAAASAAASSSAEMRPSPLRSKCWGGRGVQTDSRCGQSAGEGETQAGSRSRTASHGAGGPGGAPGTFDSYYSSASIDWRVVDRTWWTEHVGSQLF
jgi:hypothetical protein